MRRRARSHLAGGAIPALVLAVTVVAASACTGGGTTRHAQRAPGARCEERVADISRPLARELDATIAASLDAARREIPSGPAQQGEPVQAKITGEENELGRHERAYEAFPSLVCSHPQPDSVLRCMSASTQAAKRIEATGADDKGDDQALPPATTALTRQSRRAAVVFESASFCVKEAILGRFPTSAPLDDRAFRECAASGLATASAYAGLSSCAPLLKNVESQLPSTTTTTTTAPA